MTEKITLKKSEILYKGFNTYSKYDIDIPSIKKDVESIHLYNHEILHSKDSVILLIYASDVDSFIFCRQFRPGIYLCPNKHEAYPLECVAGSIDSDEAPEAIAKREAKEEVGVEIDQMECFCKAFVSPGISTEQTHIFYSEITSPPTATIGGLENSAEEIKVEVIPRKQTYEMMEEGKIKDLKTLLAISYFRLNKEPK